MSKFLQGHALNASVEAIIQEAKEKLILVSPYIKLNHRYLDGLKQLKKCPECQIQICFGKSEGKYYKSFDPEALRFLMEMPNIKIVYDERLHAKFYANESRSLLTSMNLYDYSQDKNIEVGVESEVGRIKRSQLDAESWHYFTEVIDQAAVVFNRVPEFKKGFMGLTQSYVGSETLIDKIEIPENSERKKRATEERAEKKSVEAAKESTHLAPNNKKKKREKSQEPEKQNQIPQGFCIRTGQSIPFDVMRPLSGAAFNSWAQFGDGDYPEAFCHFSGEPSYGDTSYHRPILQKNWRKAKKWIN